MKKYISICCCCILFLAARAQQESNTWMFGQNNALQFDNYNIPQPGGVPGWGDIWNPLGFARSNAVCDAGGQLLFYVALDVFTTGSSTSLNNVLNIYRADGAPMANSNLLINTPVNGPIQIIKKPGSNKIYYVAYALNGSLLYTAVDMGLNNGTGGVVATEKSVVLSPWQTIIGEKTVVVPGCDGVWLVVRSLTGNQYKSYTITEEGIDPVPVISDCGLLPLIDYKEGHIGPPGGYTSGLADKKIGMAGTLKASPDGRTLAACTDGGLELYDFSRCSGTVSHARMIDTTGIYVTPYYSINGYTTPTVKSSYYGACFSPDGTKLYATYMFGRYVWQFDLDQPTPEAIMASKTAVLKNRPMKFYDFLICIGIDTTGMGDLKLGPDGKIYIGNNAGKSCSNDTAFAQNSTLHVIHNPDAAGPACNAQLDIMILPSASSVDFNREVGFAPAGRDSLSSFNFSSLCYPDSLQADSTGDCYHWNTGASTATINVDTSGLYVVTWTGKDCTYHTDSFRVYVPPMPEVPALFSGCPGEIRIRVSQKAGDTTTYQYTLQQRGGVMQQVARSNTGHQFTGLESGDYTLNVTTATGCDTVFNLFLQDYPKPELVVTPFDTTIRYGDSVRLSASGALLYTWWPSGLLDTAILAAPVARPLQPTVFTVLGLNEYGCRDTAQVHIHINDPMPGFIPNAFSPNGDGLNDIFRLSGITFQKVSVFKIFDRYGHEVFNTTDAQAGWDGTRNGKPCDAGTYYYQLILVYPDGNSGSFKGDLTLLR